MRAAVIFFVCGALAAARASVPVAADGPTVVVVVGAGGEPEYGRAFEEWAGRWAEAARQGGAELVEIGRGGGSEGDREMFHQVLAEAAKEPSRPLWLVLIGHGTFNGREAKFNLRGPDFSDVELAQWLAPLKRPLAVINCASASGPYLKRLAGPNRVVITATRSGSENNFARFGDHMSAAVLDPAADLDKDGQTSLLEAFIAASHRTQAFYKEDVRLATEHALLEDNGDGLGIPADWFQGTRATKSARDGAPLDGLRAHQWHLVLSESERAMPAAFRAERDKQDLEVESLRAKKASLAEADYYTRLEKLLVELARFYERESGTGR